MVGEIRDLKPRKWPSVVLTGTWLPCTLTTPQHLTASSMLEVEPFLITSAVVGVVAQRLIRVICLDCKEPYKPEPAIIQELGYNPKDVENITFFHGRGCSECNYTGFKGRSGIFELLILSDAAKELVLNRESSSVIFRQARKDGMRTMREDGWEKVLQGLTTVEEVLSSTSH